MTAISLEPLDLAALLCSRVCHDVISPVGAIVNALEVLEEDDPSMKEFALDLIKKSARSASARLQFARLAFGAAGSAGSTGMRSSIDSSGASTGGGARSSRPTSPGCCARPGQRRCTSRTTTTRRSRWPTAWA